MGRLFDELKRRNVIRVALAYLVASWLVLQVADLVLENIGSPEWVMQVFLLIFFLGFPLALIFSWAYELTPEGLKRESDVHRDSSITGDTGRKLDMVTIGMLVAVLLFVGFERNFRSSSGTDTAISSTVAVENSIAVLAFQDLSPDGDQAYFAEGLSEELLNVLAQVAELSVAGRTSSFAFKGQNTGLQEIGEILNVTHILEGSVRKSGDRIRVTAQLIKTSDGFHVFSETYDRDLEDIFAVQDEIAQKISTALLSEIIGTESLIKVTQTDPEAYELYLLARQRINSRDTMALQEASSMLDRALEISPDYAPAIAQKALATYLLSDASGAYGDTPRLVAQPAAMKLVSKALALDDGLAEAHAVQGLLFRDVGMHEESIAATQRALSINPNMSDAANWLANTYSSLGKLDESRAIYERIVERDPVYGPAFGNLTQSYVRTSNFDRAESLISRVQRIVGENDEIRISRGFVAVMTGDASAAVQDLSLAHVNNPNATITLLWYGFALIGVADYETVARIGLPEHRMIAYHQVGELEKALSEMHDLDIKGTFPQRVVGDIGDILLAEGSSQQYIDYVNEQFGSVATLLEDYPLEIAWGAGYLPTLAYAHLQIGDGATYDMLLEEMLKAQEIQREAGTNNWVTSFARGQYAALNSDTEVAITSLEQALDRGLRSPYFFDSPVFASLHDDPRFDELVQRLADLVDGERAKLGMPPYRPIAPTDEEKPRSSFVN
jgi:TolB-like protein